MGPRKYRTSLALQIKQTDFHPLLPPLPPPPQRKQLKTHNSTSKTDYPAKGKSNLLYFIAGTYAPICGSVPVFTRSNIFKMFCIQILIRFFRMLQFAQKFTIFVGFLTTSNCKKVSGLFKKKH
jgi:hypothetical protein